MTDSMAEVAVECIVVLLPGGGAHIYPPDIADRFAEVGSGVLAVLHEDRVVGMFSPIGWMQAYRKVMDPADLKP